MSEKTFDLNTDRLLTPVEVADLTGYTEKTVRSAYLAGKLKAFQTEKGGRVRIPLSAVYEWVGRPAAKTAEPALEDVDWETPREGSDPNDLVICDEFTLYLRVAQSRAGEFFEAKQRAGR